MCEIIMFKLAPLLTTRILGVTLYICKLVFEVENWSLFVIYFWDSLVYLGDIYGMQRENIDLKIMCALLWVRFYTSDIFEKRVTSVLFIEIYNTCST